MEFKYDKENEQLIVQEATRIEYHQLSLWLTRFVKGYKFMQPYKMGVWNGKKSYFENGKIALGLWKECLSACKEIGVPFKMINKKDFPVNRDITFDFFKEFCYEYFKNHKVKTKTGWVNFMPYDHQIDSAYKIIRNRYCMVEVATSGGKSLIISLIMFYILKHVDRNAKFLIIVPSITLVTQFYDNIIEYNYGQNKLNDNTPEEIENKHDDVCRLRVEEVMSDKPRKYSGKKDANIYIGTYQSLEKFPKEFFKQFHTVVTDECHKGKSKSYKKILKNTIGSAYLRFGVTGTLPSESSCEILDVQSVLGPKISQVSATELKNKGIIAPVEIKSIIMNHNDREFNERIQQIRKSGYGKEAFDIEKDYLHLSESRLDFIKKIVNKCKSNTLVLFNTIEYGKKILEKLKNDIPNKEFFYIDGEVSGKKREEIKGEMEKTYKDVEYIELDFGSYKIEVRPNYEILLSDKSYKKASDITKNDDIDDDFIEKLKK